MLKEQESRVSRGLRQHKCTYSLSQQWQGRARSCTLLFTRASLYLNAAVGKWCQHARQIPSHLILLTNSHRQACLLHYAQPCQCDNHHHHHIKQNPNRCSLFPKCESINLKGTFKAHHTYSMTRRRLKFLVCYRSSVFSMAGIINVWHNVSHNVLSLLLVIHVFLCFKF